MLAFYELPFENHILTRLYTAAVWSNEKMAVEQNFHHFYDLHYMRTTIQAPLNIYVLLQLEICETDVPDPCKIIYFILFH